MNLSVPLLVDLLVVGSCGSLVFAKARAGHSHPAVIYLIFHVLVITTRLYAVENGAPTFLTGLSGYEGVSLPEIHRAVVYADIALVAGTLGWMTARKRTNLREAPYYVMTDNASPVLYRFLRFGYVWKVAVVAVPLGLAALATYAFVPGIGLGATSNSSYLTFAMTWPGLMLIALIYCRGFKVALLIPLIGYLGIMAVQGYSRFRLVIPLILLVQIYLDRRGRRWPDTKVGVILLVSVLIFFPLKQIGRSVQSGEGLSSIRLTSQESISKALLGQSGDQVILDQFAMTLSLVDDSGRIFGGVPYLSFLTLPVPRELWAGKPGLSDHLKVISKPSRPLDDFGSVTTLPGDLYLNFRLPGLVLFMFLLARWSAKLYEAAYRRPYRSVGRFAFMLFSCNLIQTYRDGFVSAPFFLLVQMLPLVVVIVLHIRRPSSIGPARSPGIQPATPRRASAS